MSEYFERTHELEREGLPEGLEPYIEEKITNEKEVNIGVKLSRYQYRRSASPERGILISGGDDPAALFMLLTEQEQQVILDSIKSLLSARLSTSVPLVSTDL